MQPLLQYYLLIIRVRMATFLEEDVALFALADDSDDADVPVDDPLADDELDPDALEDDLDFPADTEEE